MAKNLSLRTWAKINDLLTDDGLLPIERVMLVTALYAGKTQAEVGKMPYADVQRLYAEARAFAENPGGKLQRKFRHKGKTYLYDFRWATAPVAQWADIENYGTQQHENLFALIVSRPNEPYNGTTRLERAEELSEVPANIALPILGNFMRPTVSLWANIRLFIKTGKKVPRRIRVATLQSFTSLRTT